MKKTHCLRGHAYTPENTIWKRLGRECRSCSVDREKRRWREQRRPRGNVVCDVCTETFASAVSLKTHRNATPACRPTEVELFWGKVAVGSEVECWPYLGAIDLSGYGAVQFRGRHRNAHRVAYILTHDFDPVGLDVDHLCRNPVCCNPDHLEAVSHRENTRRGMWARRHPVAA